MAYPGRGRHSLAADLAFMEEAGIGAIVSVCEEGFAAEAAGAGFALLPWEAAVSSRTQPYLPPAARSFLYLHLPTVIMEAPSLAAIDSFLELFDNMSKLGAVSSDDGVDAADADALTRLQSERMASHSAARTGLAVHCLAGQGRTGTLLAAALLARRRALLAHGGRALAISAEDAAAEAVEQLRRIRPGSIESAAQESAVRAVAVKIFE